MTKPAERSPHRLTTSSHTPARQRRRRIEGDTGEDSGYQADDERDEESDEESDGDGDAGSEAADEEGFGSVDFAAPASSDSVRVIRFCDRNRPETRWCPDSQHKGSVRTQDDWHTPDATRDQGVLRRALAHMDGATANSPFVSVASDEAALVKWGHSGGLRDIMFGVDKPDEQAPHIGVFDVPRRSLVTPDDIRQDLPGSGSSMGLARARIETERLYYGDDIDQHLVEWKDNPYNPHTYQKILDEHDAERRQAEAEEDAREAAREVAPPPLAPALVKAELDAFQALVTRFAPQSPGAPWGDVTALTGKEANLAMRRALSKLDSYLLDDAAVRQQWLAATQSFRNG